MPIRREVRTPYPKPNGTTYELTNEEQAAISAVFSDVADVSVHRANLTSRNAVTTSCELFVVVESADKEALQDRESLEPLLEAAGEAAGYQAVNYVGPGGRVHHDPDDESVEYLRGFEVQGLFDEDAVEVTQAPPG